MMFIDSGLAAIITSGASVIFLILLGSYMVETNPKIEVEIDPKKMSHIDRFVYKILKIEDFLISRIKLKNLNPERMTGLDFFAAHIIIFLFGFVYIYAIIKEKLELKGKKDDAP